MHTQRLRGTQGGDSRPPETWGTMEGGTHGSFTIGFISKISVYTYIYIYMYVYTCVYMYVCMYVCIYIYIYTHIELFSNWAQL